MKHTVVIGSIYRIYGVEIGAISTPLDGYVSYIGKYGFSLAANGREYPCTYDRATGYDYTLISYPINPTTSLPCTESEVREFYPEFFI